jgi:hypothetical protein
VNSTTKGTNANAPAVKLNDSTAIVPGARLIQGETPRIGQATRQSVAQHPETPAGKPNGGMQSNHARLMKGDTVVTVQHRFENGNAVSEGKASKGIALLGMCPMAMAHDLNRQTQPREFA